MASSIFSRDTLEAQHGTLILLIITNNSDAGAANLCFLMRLLRPIVAVEGSLENDIRCQISGRLVSGKEACLNIQQHFIHSDLEKHTFASIGECGPEVTEPLVEHTVAAQLVEPLQFILEERLKIALEHTLIIQTTKRFAIGSLDGHVLVRHHMHGGLQGNFAVIICPALRGVMQFAQIDELAPAPRTVTFASKNVVSSVSRGLGGVFVVHHSDLVMSCLAPAG
mmetsp:Transcript_33736/g.54386  ORF Transcript_33736/g.54386 Transcript_33736/m.54386 type:complete len:224 (+) Transcript_33736:1034-1705(+)